MAFLHQLPCVCFHVRICDSSASLVQVYGTGAVLLHTKCHFYWERTLNRISKYSTVKPVLSGHTNIDKTKILKTNGSLMKVESIAECSLGAFYNTFDLH